MPRRSKKVVLEPYEENTQIYTQREEKTHKPRIAYAALPAVAVAVVVAMLAVIPSLTPPPPPKIVTVTPPTETITVTSTISTTRVLTETWTTTTTIPPQTVTLTQTITTTSTAIITHTKTVTQVLIQTYTTSPSPTKATSKTGTPITSCTTITKPGYYYLANDIKSGHGWCIIIAANNVTIDGNGHKIEHGNIVIGEPEESGIRLVGRTGIVIKNIVFRNSLTAIDGELENCLIEGNKFISDYITIGFEGTLSYCLVKNNEFINSGLSLTGFSRGNIIIINNFVNGKPLLYFENRKNVVIENIEIGQLIVMNSTNITIRMIKISNTSSGIFFYKVINSIIEGCEISKNIEGIRIFVSNNVTIKNNAIFNHRSDRFGRVAGVIIEDGQNHRLINNTIKNNDIGIMISSSNIIIASNKIINNSKGIYIEWILRNSIIYNNLFNNFENVYIYGKSIDNLWNLERATGKNILGGDLIGGNVWLSPDGKGCSQLCEDKNKDGFCDTPCWIGVRINNTIVDYFPLKYS